MNLDGLIGPTHNFSGLSYGNIASFKNSRATSNPKEAAKQGLEKMRSLSELGIRQAVMPPQERPFLPLLYTLGYTGSEAAVLEKASRDNPEILLACCSSSSMWTANAATVSPSCDAFDKKIHFTPANLSTKLHRSIEVPFTSYVLKKIFQDPRFFTHHMPLPPHATFADEGAANHTRFCRDYGTPGVELFVYGRSAYRKNLASPRRFPARQTLEASQTIARLHGLNPDRVIFAQQNPNAIDAGVFHNDVISVGNQNLFFTHEDAFIDTTEVLAAIQRKTEETYGSPLQIIIVTKDQITLEESVSTYLFNSQLVTLSDQSMVLIAPRECNDSPAVRSFLKDLIKDNSQPIRQVIFRDVCQSMQNGGGPACLRLRIVMNEEEYSGVHSRVILTPDLYDRLSAWIDHNYRDRIDVSDLLDPHLLQESRVALDELTKILRLGSIYPFQFG